MNNKESALLEKAKNYSFLLLKFRLRSERELYQRLKKKKFSEEIIKQTLAFLNDKGFINDELFTKNWIEYRLKKPFGLNRIKQELKLKGIDAALINNQIEQIKKNYSEEGIILELIKKRVNKLKGIEPQKAKRRIFSYLIRRGFRVESVMDALNQLNF